MWQYKKIRSDHLISLSTQSCGYIQKEKAKTQIKINSKFKKPKWKHFNKRLYSIWNGIKNRCYNVNNNKYKNYGARGIKVCDEWLNSFDNFYEWAINNGFDENVFYMDCTIDRIDNKKNYEPNNCRWVSQKIQQNNKSNNHLIFYKGEYYTLSQLSKKININYNSLKTRIRLGWNIDKIISTSVKHYSDNQG